MRSFNRREILFLLAVGAVLLTSIFVRIDGTTSVFPLDDEIIVMIAATKLNTPHPGYDPREYNYEHPPLGKFILGWPLPREKEYYNTSLIPINLYVYSYLAAPELREQLPMFRMWTAILGLLFLVALFYLGKELFDSRTGLMAVLFAGVSIGFINLSRIVFQDIVLPLFITLSLIFFIRYAKGDLSIRWNRIPIPYFDLGIALFFMGASLLTRIGQPPFFLAGVAIGMWTIRGKRLPFSVGVAIMMGGVLLNYPLTLILELASKTHAGAFLQQTHTDILWRMLSMTSYAFIGGIILVFVGAIFHHRKKIKNLKEGFQKLSPTHRIALGVAGITLLAAIFSQLGLQARYFMVFLIIPIIYGAHAMRKYATEWTKVLIVGLLLVDCIVLIGATPNLREHVLYEGAKPFIPDAGEEFLAFQKNLQSNHVNDYITNDARIILMDPNAKPVPPFHKGYHIADKCNAGFFTNNEGKIFIYNPSYRLLEKNTFLCPIINSERLQRISSVQDPFGFEWYRIQGIATTSP